MIPLPRDSCQGPTLNKAHIRHTHTQRKLTTIQSHFLEPYSVPLAGVTNTLVTTPPIRNVRTTYLVTRNHAS